VQDPVDEPHGLRRWVSPGRLVLIGLAGVSLYLVAPQLVAVFGSWPRLSGISVGWFVAAIGCQAISFIFVFILQRLALRTDGWFAVVTSQLAGNAVSRVVPAGAAAGAALQFRMLTVAGMEPATAVSGLTAFSLLQTAGLLALPIFALPALLAGVAMPRGFAQAVVLGAVAFVLVAVIGVVLLATDRPLAALGQGWQAARNRLLRKRPPLTGLPDRLLLERDEIRRVLESRWWEASLAIAGKLGFDFLSLLAALQARTDPHPSLILLAYTASLILAMVPITPGGLGFVEAGLTALLTLAGIPAGEAVLATLMYRLVSYWLPILAGPVAYVLYRRRYGSHAGRTS
jgi:uncharacterized membrane protein YbhN (UPF0104 family)